MSNPVGFHSGKTLDAFDQARKLMAEVENSLQTPDLKAVLATMMKVQDRIAVAYGHLMSISCECEMKAGVTCAKHWKRCFQGSCPHRPHADDPQCYCKPPVGAEVAPLKPAKKAKAPEDSQWKCVSCGNTTTDCEHVIAEEIAVKVREWLKTPEATKALEDAMQRVRETEERLRKAREIDPRDLHVFGPVRKS